MTLTDAVRTFFGTGAVFDDPAAPNRVNPVDLLTEADRRAEEILIAYGVLYSDHETGEDSAEAVIEELARAYSGGHEVDEIKTALDAAGVVLWDRTGPKHVTDMVRWYAEPHMRAAYYLGLAIGWRLAQRWGGVR